MQNTTDHRNRRLRQSLPAMGVGRRRSSASGSAARAFRRYSCSCRRMSTQPTAATAMPTRKAVRANGVTKYPVIVVCALSVATNRAAARTGQRSTEWSEASATTNEPDMVLLLRIGLSSEPWIAGF